MKKESIIVIVVVIALIQDLIHVKSSEISTKVVKLHLMIHGIHSPMDTTNSSIKLTHILTQFCDVLMKCNHISMKGIHLPKHLTLHIKN